MKVAFVGLGSMGSLMAAQLAEVPDVELALFDLDDDRLRSLSNLGRVASSVADAAADADAIFSVVPADRHVRAVVDDLLPVAREGQIYVDFSTIGPRTIEEVQERLARCGVETVSAGMTQSIEGAATGTLRLFAGGPATIPPVIGPALDALTAEIRLVGGVGAAKALKLINNMVVACADVAICEALVLGEQHGLAYEQTVKGLSGEGADSWPLHHHIIAHVLPDDLGEGFFSTRFLIKDLTLCMQFLAEHGLPSMFAGLATSFYRGTAAMGHGDDYHMIVIRWLERTAAFDGPRRPRKVAAPEHDPAEVPRTLAHAVAAIQLLVCAEALRALARMGVAQRDAAEHLEAGSAGNDSLRGLIGRRGSGSALTPAALAADLQKAVDLAREVDVPATMFELARHVALDLGERHGTERNVWSTPAAGL